MTPRRPLLLLALVASPLQALAQAPAAATVTACVAMEIDAERLACYDAQAGRAAPTTAQADAAAEQARRVDAAVDAAVADAAPTDRPARERARAALGDLFGQDSGSTELARANAGKGSLLDSRWELARDSKLGTFNFRAYKPVYLLPVFFSSDQNATPTSPSRSSGTPITATCATLGCATSTPSTSAGYTLKPPTMNMSLMRSVMRR